MYVRTANPTQFNSLLGEPGTKAAPTLTREAELRIAKVAKTMTQALQLATDASPFLKTDAQKELLQFIVGSLRAFFPKGFGAVNEQGAAIRGSLPLRYDDRNRTFVYDVRLSISDQIKEARGSHRSMGTRGSHINLYARQLFKERPNELVGTAIHEMIHMLRNMARSYDGKFGESVGRNFPSRAVAALVNVGKFSGHRDKFVGHFKKLVAFLKHDSKIWYEESLATPLADTLVEEVMAFVVHTRMAEAIAILDAKRMAKKTKGGVGLSEGFHPQDFAKTYIQRHWFPEEAAQASLKKPETLRIIDGMAGDLLALEAAMQAHVGP